MVLEKRTALFLLQYLGVNSVRGNVHWRWVYSVPLSIHPCLAFSPQLPLDLDHLLLVQVAVWQLSGEWKWSVMMPHKEWRPGYGDQDCVVPSCLSFLHLPHWLLHRHPRDHGVPKVNN